VGTVIALVIALEATFAGLDLPGVDESGAFGCSSDGVGPPRTSLGLYRCAGSGRVPRDARLSLRAQAPLLLFRKYPIVGG
jgi:hypothetical protein